MKCLPLNLTAVTLCVGMQTGTLRVRAGTQEDCFRQPETGRGASQLHSHAERGNEENHAERN
ncbi:MAG: hypothetical protein GY749_19825 [Desulfobacteraceae bacterium]|nr:hypothetical protein [Desulfobacteraceae bacterium]